MRKMLHFTYVLQPMKSPKRMMLRFTINNYCTGNEYRNLVIQS